MDKRTLLLVTFALTISIAVSVYMSYNRIKAEEGNNSVELTADYSDIERLASFENVPADKVLACLKAAGITSIALTEDLSGSVDVNFLSGIDPKKMNLYVSGMGLSISKIRLIQGAGLKVIPRIRNSFSLNNEKIIKKISTISGYGTVIFAEEEVLGYPNYLKEAARSIKSAGMKYGFIEFGKQLGDSALSSYLPGNLVKVHSIPVDEMENLTKGEMVDRFVRAAKERSIRILYVHLLAYPDNGKDLLQTNVQFIQDLKKAIDSAGFRAGKASSPMKVTTNKFVTGVIGLGIAGGFILLSSFFTPINFIYSIVIMFLFAAMPAKYLALASAIIFPAYAVISQFPVQRERVQYGYISKAVSISLYIAGITAVGAMIIGALLSDKIGMLGVEGFSGVKLAFLCPVVIVAAYFFLRGDDGKLNIKSSFSKVGELISMNLTVFHVFLLLIAAAAGALMILRSGNFGVPVPGAEKLARGLLENALNIRPRTKEFLLGYPAIVMAAIYYLKGGSRWLWLWLSVAVLAPISMTNSFCHIHTPLIISLVRSCVGLLLGISIGLIAYLFYSIGAKLVRTVNK